MPSIQKLRQQLDAGTTTSVKIIEDALAKIDAHRQSGGNAFIRVRSEESLVAAKALDSLRSRNYGFSQLAGLPVSIKDLFDIKNEVTTAGSVVFSGNEPARNDAKAVEALRKAGAIFIGRTNMSEFAYSGVGVNPHYGTPRNPFDPARVAGGSTSGGAVSVAIGAAVAALGTDTGGSLRIPAAFCGLVGFKPTARRISNRGAFPLSASFDSVGSIASSVDCCAVMDSVLTAAEHYDLNLPVKGLRLGITFDAVMSDLDDNVMRAFQRAVGIFEDAGAVIRHFDFPEIAMAIERNAQRDIVASEAWTLHRNVITESEREYDRQVAMRIKRGTTIAAEEYLSLQNFRRRAIEAFRTRLSQIDAWIMPTVAIDPPAIDVLTASDDNFLRLNALALRNTGLINFLDGCALTIPCHEAGGLPVGLSICGPSNSDAKIIQIGRSLESLLKA